MQYSPMNNIPYVGRRRRDGRARPLVRRRGRDLRRPRPASSRRSAASAGLASHRGAGRARAADQGRGVRAAWTRRCARLGADHRVRRACEFILGRLRGRGADLRRRAPDRRLQRPPRRSALRADARTTPTRCSSGDTILIDLWARRKDPPAIYYDITWCGFAGETPPAMYAEIFRVVARGARRGARVRARAARRGRARAAAARSTTRAARWSCDAGYGERSCTARGTASAREVHGNGANIDNLETRDERLLVPGHLLLDRARDLPRRAGWRCAPRSTSSSRPAGEVEVYGPIQRELIRIG